MRLTALLLLALLAIAQAQPYFTWSVFPSYGSAPAPRGQISSAVVTFPDGNQKYIVYGGAQSPAATGLQFNDMVSDFGMLYPHQFIHLIFNFRLCEDSGRST